MAKEEQENGLHFDLPKNRSSVIKVIGVGGGGSNAVNHMKEMGIKGVDFMICNTDAQALEHSAVENRIQLGAHLTEGLGAGANPDVGRESATESLEEIREVLKHNTRMVFITAGMGGGTGTGAAPVIAKLAREMNILTVGIVTKPFRFEGKIRAKQAQEGIEMLRDQVDSLVVINNDKLREVYGNLSFRSGFAKADEVLATAAKGIAEVITYHYTTNIDLRDVRTVLENSGTAIMGSAAASGEDRAQHAVKNALDSPLLDNNHIEGAKNVLLLIVSGSGDQEITMDEMGYINEHIQDEAGGNANVILGIGLDESLDDTINVTIIATGFPTKQGDAINGRATSRIVHPLEEDQPIEKDVFENRLAQIDPPKAPSKKPSEQPDLFSSIPKQAVVHDLYTEENEPTDEFVNEEPIEEVEEETRTNATDVAVAEVENQPTEDETNLPLENKTETEEVVFLDLEDDFEVEDEIETEEEITEEPAPVVAEKASIEADDFEMEDEVVAEEDLTANNEAEEVDDPTFEDDVTFELDDIEGEGIELHVENKMEEPATEAQNSSEEFDPFDFKIDDVMGAPTDEPTKIEIEEPEEEIVNAVEPEEPLTEAPKKNETIKHTLEDLLELERKLQIKQPAKQAPAQQEEKQVMASIEPEKEELLDFAVSIKKEEPTSYNKEQEVEETNLLDKPIGAASRKKILERKARLEAYNYKFKAHKTNMLEKEPAFKRQGFDVGVQNYSSAQSVSNMSIGGEGEETSIKTNNSFLHDNVD